MPKREMPEAKIIRLYEELDVTSQRIVFGLLQAKQKGKVTASRKPSKRPPATAAIGGNSADDATVNS